MMKNVVAIVEEDTALFGRLDRLLTSIGRRTIRLAADGSARPILQRTRPGLLIVDIGRVGTEITTLLLQVRLSPRLSAMPVIVCSPDNRYLHTIARDGDEIGWTLLPKPLEVEDLLNAIDQATHRTAYRAKDAA